MFLFWNACPRNTHVEATLHRPFPAQVTTVGLLWRKDGSDGDRSDAPDASEPRREAREAREAALAEATPLPPEVGVFPSLALIPREKLWEYKREADAILAAEAAAHPPDAPRPAPRDAPPPWKGPVPPITPQERAVLDREDGWIYAGEAEALRDHEVLDRAAKGCENPNF